MTILSNLTCQHTLRVRHTYQCSLLNLADSIIWEKVGIQIFCKLLSDSEDISIFSRVLKLKQIKLILLG